MSEYVYDLSQTRPTQRHNDNEEPPKNDDPPGYDDIENYMIVRTV